MLADATPHVHSNSPPAMPCSNRPSESPIQRNLSTNLQTIEIDSFSAFTNLSDFCSCDKRPIRPAQHRIPIMCIRMEPRRAPKSPIHGPLDVYSHPQLFSTCNFNTIFAGEIPLPSNPGLEYSDRTCAIAQAIKMFLLPPAFLPAFSMEKLLYTLWLRCYTLVR